VPLRLPLVVVALVAVCGCTAQLGLVSATSWGWQAHVPLAGRTRGSFSLGSEVHLSLVPPEAEGDLGLELALPYEERTTKMRHAANLSKGDLRSQSTGVGCRCVYLRSAETGKKYLWFGTGPEYHWNKFVPSDSELATAALSGIAYDEDIKDCFGWSVCAGCDFLPWGIFILEVSYHWLSTKTVVEGIDNGIPFRRSRRERMEWLSSFLGLRLRF